MTEPAETPPTPPAPTPSTPAPPPHPLQRLMDNPWALLALGVGIPTVSYTIWGWIELALVAPARLP